LVKHWKVTPKVMVEYNRKRHLQFNLKHVCTLKVSEAGDRHGFTAQQENTGITTFGFLGSQNSTCSTERGGKRGHRSNVECQEEGREER